jgi:predicted signal transduction protein with EAL and GGDEF domain
MTASGTRRVIGSSGSLHLLDEVLARADTALYQAKNSGRDLVCYAQESFETASTAVRRSLRQN